MRTMGLDIGERRIGVALSDPEGVLALPLTVLTRRGDKADLEALCELVRQHGVGRIVAGLPYSLNGTEGKQAGLVRGFLHQLSKSVDISIETFDERLSSVAVERMVAMAGASRAERKKPRDAAAAAFILQGYLDRARI